MGAAPAGGGCVITPMSGRVGVFTAFTYRPALHDPLKEPTASAFVFNRHAGRLFSKTKAPPTPTPLPGAMLPAAMWSGLPVNKVCAHPKNDLKVEQLCLSSSPS